MPNPVHTVSLHRSWNKVTYLCSRWTSRPLFRRVGSAPLCESKRCPVAAKRGNKKKDIIADDTFHIGFEVEWRV